MPIIHIPINTLLSLLGEVMLRKVSVHVCPLPLSCALLRNGVAQGVEGDVCHGHVVQPAS